MIDPRELRIGNWITSDGENFQVTLLRTDYIGAGALGIYTGGFDEDFAIPLTSEWLERFGFSAIMNVPLVMSLPLKTENDDELLTFECDGKVMHIVRFGKSTRRQEMKYVHQLQNLYFALTGQELELKS